MIRIVYRRTDHCITVEGHAGYGKKGRDPVCAAVSALVLTAAGNVLQLSAQESVSGEVVMLSPGNARVGCDPRPHMESVVTLMLDTICTGFELLQNHYPENVRFRIVG